MDPPPPPYWSGQTSVPENSKGLPSWPQQQNFQSTQQQQQHPPELQQQYSHPQVQPSSGSSFHVYKAPGIFVKDDIITGDDKNQIQYYLEFPQQFFSGWNMTLRLGGKQGRPVMRITKGSFGDDFLVEGLGGENWKRPVVKGGFFSKAHTFASFDGVTDYKWSGQAFSNDLTCSKKVNDQKIIVASWRNTSFAISKDGHLIIEPGYERDTILILATALAMEEWCREKRD